MSKVLVDRDRVVESMCLTWRHDFGLDKLEGCDFCSGMTDKERDHMRGQMGKLFDHHFAPALSAVTAERDRLLVDLERAHRATNSECMDWAREYERRKEVQAERDQLRAEVEGLRKDAERYRWLRDQAPKARGEWEIDGQRYGMMLGADQDDVDQAVDALMSAMAAKEASDEPS